MADQRMIVRFDEKQLDDIKAFVRKESDRDRALTPELADLALSLAGWIEVTSLGDPTTRRFIPGPDATDDTPAGREAKLRRKLDRLDQDLGSMDPAGTVDVAWIRSEIARILR